jgi:hypothetical protein
VPRCQPFQTPSPPQRMHVLEKLPLNGLAAVAEVRCVVMGGTLPEV